MPMAAAWRFAAWSWKKWKNKPLLIGVLGEEYHLNDERLH